MLNDVIIQLSNQFIKEASQSPILIADMAAMEKYMAESYSGRAFIELLQNADDCSSSKILVKQKGKNLYIANDGRPFDKTDVIAICRSGASSKKRGNSIGYRGIGFKSSIYLSNDIVIASADTIFTFSKQYCAKVLYSSENSVPTVRIPFLVTDLEENIEQEIVNIIGQKYNTVFVFKDADFQKFALEMQEINSDVFVFLNHILECKIQLDDVKNHFLFERYTDKVGVRFNDILNGNNSWYLIGQKNAEIAFKLKENEICECDEKESIYHSYLPTKDKTPFRIKINGDFSTDPSRKHLIIDEVTTQTLERLEKQIVELVEAVLRGESYINAPNLLFIFKNQYTFSEVNTKLLSGLKEKLKHIQLKLYNGSTVSITNYKLLPTWIDTVEANIIREYSEYIKPESLPPTIYNCCTNVDEFISMFSKTEYSIDDLYMMTKEKLYVLI